MTHFHPSQKKIILLSALGLLMSACTTKSPVSSADEIPSTQERLEQIETKITVLGKGLDRQFEKICSEQNAELNNKLENSRAKLSKSRKRNSELEKSCSDRAQASIDGRIIVGEIEEITLIEENITRSARIDTGAVTSSLGVYNLQVFERDGRQWVRFALDNESTAPRFEYRVRGRARIKQSAVSEADERYEIRMSIRMGGKDYPRQVFNLSDRSFLDHQILIGRNFLTDVAVVDTATRYRLKRK